ncbi:hypothetical protein ILUMI_23777 [Ignelater luminosus]|uniref:Uncharacterized protein n=1 Tax=Ignelater luminosus TaxID=2038154 RepID=A0A8K0CBV0_IGNLU|nr:hypothetical protein ILUMI_23777 [Ignelater luminosus]
MSFCLKRFSPEKKPAFRLELPEKKIGKPEPRIFYTKNEYQPIVKITDWEKQLESAPIDNDPYCPGSLNYFLSHYNRIGNAPDEPLTTTTRSVLDQIYMKDKLDQLYKNNPNKYMVNYFTYKDTLACEVDLNDKTCPRLCAESYATTMQRSYPPPYPYPMQRFSFPTIPFLQNRRYKWTQDPNLSKYKFYDDGLCEEIKGIQKIKGFRSKSYDPSRAINTDGTLPPERTQKCFELEF